MSAEIVIPPSPNWYTSDAFDCHKGSGILAYAASRNLVIIWPNEQVSLAKTRVISDAHRIKVTCVSWRQSSSVEEDILLSSAGEDGFIYIWNVMTQSCILNINVHEGKKISSLSWSQIEHNILVSTTEDGNFILTELALKYGTYTSRKLNFGKLNPSCISLSPHTPWHLAVGCKGGLLYICDTRGKQGIIHKLRSHEEDINNIDWCPTRVNTQLQQFDKQETYLVTSSFDKWIKVWAVNDGKCVTQAKLPVNTGIHRPRPNEKRSTWIALQWLSEDLILSSGLSGELLAWNVKVKSALSWKVIHKLHSRGLFNITSFGDGRKMIWTSAQDRNVVLWPLRNESPKEVLGIPEMNNPVLCISTLGGFVYCMSISSIDSSHIAIGLGDGSIRIWNMATGNPDMNMLWNGIKGKVTSLSWHPNTEGRLAFGTDEGRVGIFDTLSTKPPLLSRTYHKGTVYNLTWGSLPGKEEPVLFSCGGSVIFIHDPAAFDTEAKNFNNLINGKAVKKFPSRTELQWNSDSSLLAIGNEDGSVEIYSVRDFSLLTVFIAHKKLIQCLKWHPRFTFQSAEPSSLHSWLAVASNETSVRVFNVSVGENQVVTSNLVATLSGHKERVVSIAWNPHQDGMLLSASYDGTAQVWDVINQNPLKNFSLHSGRLLCCEWSALEPNVAITGSDDYTLCVWKVNEQVYRTPAEAIAVRAAEKNTGRALQAAISVPTPSSNPNLKGKKKAPFKLKSLLPVSSTLETRGRSSNINDIKILASLQGIALENSGVEEDSPSESTHLGLFCDQKSSIEMLHSEVQHHQEGSNFDLAAHLQTWMGDIGSILEEACKKKQLSDFLVGLAPQVSVEFWKEMCHHYSEQLLAEGEVRKAASYALISGRKHRAVEMFSNQNFLRESVALSRCLYPDGSDQVRENLSLWANKATEDGNLELAVKCHLANKDVAEAARTLARRSDVTSLKLSADLATHAGLSQLAAAYLHRVTEINEAAEMSLLSDHMTQLKSADEEQNGESVAKTN